MKINHSSRTSGFSQTQSKGSSTARPLQTAQSDHVQLSSLSTQISETRAARLTELQSALDAGKYAVPPQEIANSIITNALKS